MELDEALLTARDGIKALFADADAQGWTVYRITSDLKVRMWCPCDRRHCQWFDANPDTEDYEERHRAFLERRTCWEEGGSE